jgi:glycosyltransferase involved in cell wall biosynthesis
MPVELQCGAPPRVSVITCVYNGQPYLAQAIDSILAQTFADFEYLLVDDASTDGSPALIARYAGRDARIVPLRNAVNLNHSGALNRALAVARGQYLAILDADDLAMPERLALQAAFLDLHPEVGAVGAQVQVIGPDGQPMQALPFPTDWRLARWQILLRSPLLHSAAMLRRALVAQAGGYSVDRWYANDYILFAQLIQTAQLTNLPECLAAYRRNPRQTSSVFAKPQLGQVLLLMRAMLAERLDLRAGLPDLAVLYQAGRGRLLPDEDALRRAANLLGAIHARYEQVEPLDTEARGLVRRDCAWRWLAMAAIHRRTFRSTSQDILRRALALDPRLLLRPDTRSRLRRLKNTP